MTPRKLAILAASAFFASLAAGCAADNPLATASIADEKKTAAAKVDPVCVALAQQIDTLRTEGTVDRLEKAASGKSAVVKVKRTALAKQAELNAANSEFQTKCGPNIPHTNTAAAAPATQTAQATAAQTTEAAPPQPKN
jgi:hypothetical protein